MTATVDFLVETAAGVPMVPNAALRFRATEEMQAEWREPSGRILSSGSGQPSGCGQPRVDVSPCAAAAQSSMMIY